MVGGLEMTIKHWKAVISAKCGEYEGGWRDKELKHNLIIAMWKCLGGTLKMMTRNTKFKSRDGQV